MSAQTFKNVKELYITKGGIITIESDGKIIGATSVTQTGSKLTIEGANSSNITISNGNVIMQSNSSFNTFGSGGSFSTMSFNGGVNYTTCGDNFISCVGDGGKSFINGVEVDLSRLNEIAIKPKTKTNEPEKVFFLDTNTQISSICVKGSSGINPLPPSFLSLRLNISLVGSGDVNLDNGVLFDNLTINVKGSGDISGNQTKAIICNINLMGSGDVKGIHMSNGSINLMGSGDVNVTSNNSSNIFKNKMGSGSIRIH